MSGRAFNKRTGVGVEGHSAYNYMQPLNLHESAGRRWTIIQARFWDAGRATQFELSGSFSDNLCGP